MFRKVLHANDGSEHAFNALSLAMQIAKQDSAELHMVSIEQTGHMPALVEEARTTTGSATARYGEVVQRARTLAEARQLQIHAHVLAGHPVRDVIKLATELQADLIVVGASGHSALYDRMIGSRAQKILHYASCAVLVVK